MTARRWIALASVGAVGLLIAVLVNVISPTGVGDGGPGPTTTTTSTQDPPSDGHCMAIYKITGSWQGGFQGEVEVMNHSTSPYNGWTARWTYANGQTVDSVRNGVRSGSGAEVIVKNAEWNRSIPPEGSVSFGFTVSYSGTNSLPTVTCTSP